MASSEEDKTQSDRALYEAILATAKRAFAK